MEDLSNSIKEIAKKIGANLEGDSRNANFRGYTPSRGYLAFIRPEQPSSGEYSGLSFVVFPTYNETSDQYTCVVSICIGRGDLGEDEELAQVPYLRRSYTKLGMSPDEDGNCLFWIKTSFADGTSKNNGILDTLSAKKCKLEKIDSYLTLLPAAIIVSFTTVDVEEAKKTTDFSNLKHNGYTKLLSWLAQYAKIRGWDHNKKTVYDKQDALIKKGVNIPSISSSKIEKEIKELLKEAHYIVLQGAPGTGKTRMAKILQLSNDSKSKRFFTQFHAETNYSDFVGGIRPILNRSSSEDSSSSGIGYEYREGIFTEAVKYAIEHKEEDVYLIIDEINRANLSSVLGPVFYLFERPLASNQTNSNNQNVIKLESNSGKDIELSQLPDNFYVIGTMNTSDRSLANIDYALRRRFAWYTLYPINLKGEIKNFYEDWFNKVADLFDKYATDEELTLQPGHSYFIAGDDTTMKNRLIYEIMPLMKEYFANGLMLKAQNEFADFYYEKTGLLMYR